MLNRSTQFHADIDGSRIHFVHVKGKGRNPLPIVLTNGWPDSFFRMYKIIPLLTDPARFGGYPDDPSDVVVKFAEIVLQYEPASDIHKCFLGPVFMSFR